jgi:8-oxo-dGTP pyrophosphatase MutT (NUDIX family)
LEPRPTVGIIRGMSAALEDLSSPPSEGRRAAAAVCLRRRKGRVEVLLVSSRSGQVTLPKGRIEAGERPREAALREAREEAGVRGVASRRVGSWCHGRARQPVDGYLVTVTGEGRQHPAERWRHVRWVELRRATRALSQRCATAADERALRAALREAADRLG